MIKQMMSVASGSEFILTISASVANPNFRSLATAAGWNGSSRLTVNITAPLINTINLGSTPYPNGLRINVSASTRIGGVKNSGDAITTGVPVEINNLGTISGGGGKGADAGTFWVSLNGQVITGYGGGGGSGQGFSNASSLVIDAATAGAAGSYEQYSGALVGGVARPYAQGGTGGTGGGWGQAGGTIAYGGASGGDYSSSGIVAPDGSPAPSGNAVNGNSKVTWIAPGTRLGGLIN